MKTQNLLGIVLLMLSICALPGYAQEEDMINTDDLLIGDVDYNVRVAEMSFFDRVQMELSAQTVVGGATCSINPDKQKDYTPPPSTTRLCRTNDEHIGKTLELFIVTDEGWDFQGRKKILKGKEGCFDVEQGVKYHYDEYYCDSTTERTCQDTDGGKRTNKKGTVTFSVDGQSTKVTDACADNTRVQEIYCDKDNSVASEVKNCAGQCVNGACVDSSQGGSSESSQEEELKITLSDIEVTNGGDLTLNQEYTITGKASIKGTCDGCVIETGQGYYGQALSLAPITSSSGACGDEKTTGIKFDATDRNIAFQITDIASKEGTYRVKIGAYLGCFKDVGENQKELDSKTYQLTITSPEGEEEQDDDAGNDVTCYYCEGSDLRTAIYDNSCEDGTLEEEVMCAQEGEEPSTYCTNNPDAPACQPGEDYPVKDEGAYDGTGSAIQDTIEDFQENYLDYDNDPVVAWSVTIIGVLIVALIMMLIIMGARKK